MKAPAQSDRQAAELRLPPPRLLRTRSVASALHGRRTTRAISARQFSPQQLSDLLWAAAGINRRRGPFGLHGRTAASASNSQEILVFAALAQGLYRYEPVRHRLQLVQPGDLRRLAIGAGQSTQGDRAAVRLIYVADVGRLVNSKGFQEPGLHDPKVQRAYFYVDTGLIAANVYLYAASVGLAVWFHNCDRTGLRPRLRLTAGQHVLFGQTVGYPARARDLGAARLTPARRPIP